MDEQLSHTAHVTARKADAGEMLDHIASLEAKMSDLRERMPQHSTALHEIEQLKVRIEKLLQERAVFEKSTSVLISNLLDGFSEVKVASVRKADLVHVDHVAGKVNQLLEHVLKAETSTSEQVQQMVRVVQAQRTDDVAEVKRALEEVTATIQPNSIVFLT